MTSTATATPGWRHQLGLIRSEEERILAGVAGGLGRAHRIDPTLIRISFGVLTFAGGFGALLYLVLSVVMDSPSEEATSLRLRSDLRTVAGLACLTFGALIVLRGMGLWFGDNYVWPATLAAVGASVMWARRFDAIERAEILSPWRLVVGAVMVLAGLIAFVAANVSLYALPTLIVPFIAIAGGAAVVFGPWLMRSWSQLQGERRERIRSEERSALAAHLHDSVLQTLALIQRTDSPSRMSSLARVQERELRSWLYGRSDSLTGEHLSVAIDTVAGRIEEMHEVNVEVVTVGDAEMDEDIAALVAACGEAMNNAARHSGTKDISVYIEVEATSITAFVRDQGKGFDAGTVPGDRRGITDSIVGRVARHGGTATVTSRLGEGTEVTITMQRERTR